jgi:hypothetical protein
MKHIILIFIFTPLFSFAQNCKLISSKDKFSQAPKLSTGFLSLGQVRLTIDADSKEINFLFTLNNNGDLKCFDDASTATMLLEDGRTKINFKNSGTMNCEGFFQFTIRNTPTTVSGLQRLSTLKIKSIKFTHNKQSMNFNLDEEQKQTLLDFSACMAKEAKNLIKT